MPASLRSSVDSFLLGHSWNFASGCERVMDGYSKEMKFLRRLMKMMRIRERAWMDWGRYSKMKHHHFKLEWMLVPNLYSFDAFVKLAVDRFYKVGPEVLLCQ